MNEALEIVVRTILIGIGATAVMDLWGMFLKRTFGIPSLDYSMVGRWLGHIPRGRFVHDSIGKAAPIRGERAIGWIAHYAIGILFAAFLLMIMGLDWARQPSLLPPMLVGIFTVAAPFFIMQPGMGIGIAASKTPKPNIARLRSLITHTVFGIGLYGSTMLVTALLRPIST